MQLHEGVKAMMRSADGLEGANALVLVTEWKELLSPDFERIKVVLKNPLISDDCNLYDPALPHTTGLEYLPIGFPTDGPSWALATWREGMNGYETITSLIS